MDMDFVVDVDDAGVAEGAVVDDRVNAAEVRLLRVQESLGGVLDAVHDMIEHEDWLHLRRPDGGVGYGSLVEALQDRLGVEKAMAARYRQAAVHLYGPLKALTGEVPPVAVSDVAVLGVGGSADVVAAVEAAKAEEKDVDVAEVVKEAKQAKREAKRGEEDDSDVGGEQAEWDSDGGPGPDLTSTVPDDSDVDYGANPLPMPDVEVGGVVSSAADVSLAVGGERFEWVEWVGKGRKVPDVDLPGPVEEMVVAARAIVALDEADVVDLLTPGNRRVLLDVMAAGEVLRRIERKFAAENGH